MKILRLSPHICLDRLLALAANVASAQTNVIAYQGRPDRRGTAANGIYDLRFTLWDAVSSGNQIPVGTPITLTKTGVNVTNGIFTVQLDFGASSFPGADRFLEISVKHPVDPTYTPLVPRQQLTSSPYSIRTLSAVTADSAPAGTLTGTTLKSTVTASSLTSVGTLGNLTVTNPIAGSVTGNAANVTGTVAVANGGTGAGNATTARTNLGLGTLATVSPTGTASATTFLRGDNAWAVPAGVNNTFFNQFSNPGGAGGSTVFMALSGGTTFTTNAVANVMGIQCTFDALRVAATITASAASDNISLTLLVNGVSTGLTTGTFNVSTLNTAVVVSDTSHTFLVTPTDRVSIQLTQTTGTPVIRIATTVHCQ